MCLHPKRKEHAISTNYTYRLVEFPLGARLGLRDARRHVALLAVLHDNVEHVVLDERLNVLDDAWVAKTFQEVDLHCTRKTHENSLRRYLQKFST